MMALHWQVSLVPTREPSQQIKEVRREKKSFPKKYPCNKNSYYKEDCRYEEDYDAKKYPSLRNIL